MPSVWNINSFHGNTCMPGIILSYIVHDGDVTDPKGNGCTTNDMLNSDEAKLPSQH